MLIAIVAGTTVITSLFGFGAMIGYIHETARTQPVRSKERA